MAIKGNVGLALVDVLASDTVLLDPSADRVVVTAAVLHNTGASSVTVDVYRSPDFTSASGSRIAQYTVAGNASADIVEIVGQGYTTENIVAVGSATGVNSSITVTEYTGGD